MNEDIQAKMREIREELLREEDPWEARYLEEELRQGEEMLKELDE